ncbi:MAG: hypothetical protein JNM07_01975 [Phycisphaerae bacterium]|nr:hypothetical protein [Phycisphaerae bacterium]
MRGTARRRSILTRFAECGEVVREAFELSGLLLAFRRIGVGTQSRETIARLGRFRQPPRSERFPKCGRRRIQRRRGGRRQRGKLLPHGGVAARVPLAGDFCLRGDAVEDRRAAVARDRGVTVSAGELLVDLLEGADLLGGGGGWGSVWIAGSGEGLGRARKGIGQRRRADFRRGDLGRLLRPDTNDRKSPGCRGKEPAREHTNCESAGVGQGDGAANIYGSCRALGVRERQPDKAGVVDADG